MKVESIRVLGEHLPMTLVEVIGDDGTVGIGGADAPVSVIKPILKGPQWGFDRLIRGRESAEIPELSAAMTRAALGQSGLVAHAQAALDMALWDLEGKRRGQSLCQMFGAQKRHRVMAYASATAFDLTNGLVQPLPFKSTERLADEATKRVEEGFRAIKFGWGNHFASADLERIATIRSAIGKETRFMLDFGGPDYLDDDVSPQSAANIARLLEPYDLYFLEEPLPPNSFSDYAELKQSSPIPIATGEMLCREWEFNELMDRRAVDVIQPDAYRIGITATLSVTRRAAATGIQCVPHSPWSILAVASHVQILAAVFDDAMVEYPSPSLFTDTKRHGELIRLANSTMVETPIHAVDGFLEIPDRPGLGLGQFRHDVVKEMDNLAAKGLER